MIRSCSGLFIHLRGKRDVLSTANTEFRREGSPGESSPCCDCHGLSRSTVTRMSHTELTGVWLIRLLCSYHHLLIVELFYNKNVPLTELEGHSCFLCAGGRGTQAPFSPLFPLTPHLHAQMSPHSLTCVTSSNWDRPYSREVAAFPLVSSHCAKRGGAPTYVLRLFLESPPF